MQSLSDAISSRSSRRESSPLNCAKTLLDSLPSVMWFVRKKMRQNRSGGLSVPQFRALAYIDRVPCASLSALAEYLGSTLPTTSRIVTGLVRKNLVRRKDGSGDRRKLALQLTQRGRKILITARGAAQAEVALVLEEIPEHDRRIIARGLSLLVGRFDARGCEAPHSASGRTAKGEAR